MNSFPFRGDMDNRSILYMLKDWITTPELKVLIQSFGGNLQTDKTIVEQINQLVEFSHIWNFQNKEKITDIDKIRWAIMNEGLSREQQEITLTAAKKLGLIGCTIPSQRVYDYILVLGGVGMSCLLGIKYAKELCGKYGISASNIVGFARMREIMKLERTVTDTYALNAKTEFDLMRAAVLNVFGSLELIDRKEYISENSNKSWVMEYYNNNIPLILFAEPFIEPGKHKANTADTFSFFMKQLEVGCGVNILLITDQIYVPYQQMEAIRLLGIPYNHSVETVGFPDEWPDGLQNIQEPENYLQEIYSILQVMGRIIKNLEWCKNDYHRWRKGKEEVERGFFFS